MEDKDLETKGDVSLPEVYAELTKLSEITTNDELHKTGILALAT